MRHLLKGPQGEGSHGFEGLEDDGGKPTKGGKFVIISSRGDAKLHCYEKLYVLTRSEGVTRNKRITSVVDRANAYRKVINYFAVCIYSACTFARIFAFIIDASFVARAIRIKNAFRPTRQVRVSEITGSADTDDPAFVLAAIRVTATSVSFASIFFYHHWKKF